MSSFRRISVMLVLLLAAGCSGDRKPAPDALKEGAGAEAQGVTAARPGASGIGSGPVRIEPSDVTKGTPLRLSGDGSLSSGATVEWLVNGAVVQSGAGRTFDTSPLRKGDSILARVTGGGETVLTGTVEVRNAPPAIGSARFVLGDGQQGNGIRVETELRDADGDPVEVEISWKKNGEPAGKGDRLASAVKRGDKVEVTMTPFDGTEHGRSATIAREIRNTPPVVEGQDGFKVTGNVVTFHVRASDTDGDALVFALRDSPSGMTIHQGTGWVRWEAPSGTSGKVPFTVTVSDGSGGEATARFNVTIEEQAAASPR